MIKRTLSMIALAVLSVGLLGSCSKINERLDNLDKKVSDIENEQIASINSQITGITSSIADLGTIRSDISSLKQSASDHSIDIFNLEEADRALKDRILNLEDYVDEILPKYAEKEWVEATFSTLAQYEATCDTIAKIDSRIGALDAKLSKDIKATADSLTKWVNKTFEGYYTAAEMDAALELMQADIDSAKAAGKITDAKADSLAGELAKVKPEVDTVKANIRAEYKAAVKAAIEESEGKLTKELTDKIATANTAITNLTKRVDRIQNDVDDLLGRVEDLEGMIQSVTIVPAYSDGSVKAKDGILYLDIIVEPAKVVNTLKKRNFKVLVNKVKAQTKAVNVGTVSLSAFEVEDSAKGTITAMANISSELPVPTDSALTIAVNVKAGLSDITTKFYPVEFASNVKTEKQGESMTVTIEADSESQGLVQGNIPVADGFDASKPTTIEAGGIGTVIFDKDATATIIENAGDADNIFFSFENVTAQLSIEADMVIEITMNTAGESGGAVFSEDNASSGKVTINIPLSENVVYLKSVTLVDNEGNPIEGGVVPGSEYLDKENGILSFQVNHFSKYAIDYVTEAEYEEVTGVSLDKTSAELKVGDTLRLVATIAPEDATNKKVTWSSSETTIVAVDTTGKITAIAAGTATVTVTTEDGGETATCTVTVKDDTSSGPLKGVFSVSATEKVRFSPGNLYVKKDDSGNWNWNFYDKQYACNSLYSTLDWEVNTKRKPSQDDDESDLFSWGYGDWSKGLFSSKSYVKGHDNPEYDGEQFSKTEDWGYAFGGESSVWRTLNADEWKYLFGNSTERKGKYKCGVTVCGHPNCVVLLPDNWKWEGAVGTEWQNTGNVFEYSEETTVKWSTMEEAGAVCLPSAGYNSGDNLVGVKFYGAYWTSSGTSELGCWGELSGENHVLAYYLYFTNKSILSPDGVDRYHGNSVRLVTDVK